MNIKDILNDWLTTHGYDGLVSANLCGCRIGDDIMGCGGPLGNYCRPGYDDGIFMYGDHRRLSIKGIVKEWLKEHNYAGLYTCDCSCSISNLLYCDFLFANPTNICSLLGTVVDDCIDDKCPLWIDYCVAGTKSDISNSKENWYNLWVEYGRPQKVDAEPYYIKTVEQDDDFGSEI